MPAFAKTLKVSSKGQITLPRLVREMLGSEYVRIVIEDSHVHIRPVAQVAGALSRYARRGRKVKNEADRAWTEVVREKHRRR